MMEIVRGRTWIQTHTVQDSEDPEDLTDLSGYVLRSQIRGKIAVRNKKGIFEHPVLVDVAISSEDSIITQSLTRDQTDALAPGEYLIDIVATAEGQDESLLDPEPIRVTNRPSKPA